MVGQTMTDTKTVTVLLYDRLSLNTYSLGSNCVAMSVNTNLDADGETYPLMICGEDGTTWTIASTNSDFVLVQLQVQQIQHNLMLQFFSNTTGLSRTTSVTITDNNSQPGEKTYTFTQPQPLTNFEVTPTSLTWDHDDTTFSNCCSKYYTKSGFSDDVDAYHTQTYSTSDEFQHSWTNSSFVSYETSIESTTGGNRTYYIKPS